MAPTDHETNVTISNDQQKKKEFALWSIIQLYVCVHTYSFMLIAYQCIDFMSIAYDINECIPVY